MFDDLRQSVTCYDETFLDEKFSYSRMRLYPQTFQHGHDFSWIDIPPMLTPRFQSDLNWQILPSISEDVSEFRRPTIKFLMLIHVPVNSES
jgi:hypothetical protein